MLRTLILATLLLPAIASARDWQVDAAKSSLGFKGTYQNEGFSGSFKKFNATIAYDAADLAKSKFDVDVDLSSADTGSAERDDSLKGSDFFAVSKFPKAHFVTESFAKGADGGVVAQGKLTIRDQTKPAALKVTFAESGNTATLDVDATLKRADFGLGAGGDWTDVGADVPVHAHLALTAK
jgi:polyisoprenoid-binding protein YceI